MKEKKCAHKTERPERGLLHVSGVFSIIVNSTVTVASSVSHPQPHSAASHIPAWEPAKSLVWGCSTPVQAPVRSGIPALAAGAHRIPVGGGGSDVSRVASTRATHFSSKTCICAPICLVLSREDLYLRNQPAVASKERKISSSCPLVSGRGSAPSTGASLAQPHGPASP